MELTGRCVHDVGMSGRLQQCDALYIREMAWTHREGFQCRDEDPERAAGSSQLRAAFI